MCLCVGQIQSILLLLLLLPRCSQGLDITRRAQGDNVKHFAGTCTIIMLNLNLFELIKKVTKPDNMIDADESSKPSCHWLISVLSQYYLVWRRIVNERKRSNIK